MLDISWSELIVLIFVVLLFAGPEDVCVFMYKAGKMLRRISYLRFVAENNFERFMTDYENKNNLNNDNTDSISSSSQSANDIKNGS